MRITRQQMIYGSGRHKITAKTTHVFVIVRALEDAVRCNLVIEAGSDKIDVGAKGVITADNRDGVLYVRFRRLHGILKINNGERNLDVLNARKKFDQYDSETIFSKLNTNNTQ